MNEFILKKDLWAEKDVKPFQEYLMSFSKGKSNAIREQNIINTSLPCIAVPNQEINRIVKEIKKGNFLSFIDLWIWENWSNTSIIGHLICHIKDFDTQQKYLNIYVEKIDNWASCDLFKAKLKLDNIEKFWALSNQYILSPKPFIRRMGIKILFSFINYENYLSKIFELLEKLKDEDEYYVNMICAWLLCECFIKQRSKTLAFIQKNNLNTFVINKTIQKCRESFRVSESDKELLLKYKK